MKQIRPILVSGGLALLSALFVLGGFAAAFGESGLQAPAESSAPSLIWTATHTPTEKESGSSNPDKGEKPNTKTPTEANSPNPGKATPSKTSTTLSIPSRTPKPDTAVPAATKTEFPTTTPAPNCGPPAGWKNYTIKSGDTLFSLSQAFRTTVAQLQLANCLGTSTKIIAGQSLFVPNVPTITPNTTSTKTPKPTDTPSSKTDTTTTITSALPDPSVVGEAVTIQFTVTGSGGTPTGNVTVTDGTDSCVASVAVGTCDIFLSSQGAKTIHATYAGDSNFKSSTSGNEPHTVNTADTTTAITSALPDPSITGNAVTVVFSVNVSAPGSGTVTGSITINSDNDAATCSASAAIGTCDITLTTVGAHNLTADYLGDSNFNASSSTSEAHTVNP